MKNKRIFNAGFSFIETAFSLCIVSVSAVLISVFSAVFLRTAADIKKQAVKEKEFLEISSSFIDFISNLEVFSYRKKMVLSVSENELILCSSSGKKIFSYNFPLPFLVTKAQFVYRNDLISGIEVHITDNGENYKISSFFTDFFPGSKEIS